MSISVMVTIIDTSCGVCGIKFGLEESFMRARQKDGKWFSCPNGDEIHWTPGKSAETKLKEAEARQVALQDQLRAAIRAGDEARTETLRIRQRIANGVCPCCTRSFPNVMRHMATQHPEFAVPGDVRHAAGPFRCSCGHKFDTFRGLRIHQGQVRGDDWDAPEQPSYWAHLSVL